MTTALLSNGGPPLDDDLTHTPPWCKNGIGRYFEWAAAKKRAFDAPYDIAKLRAQRASQAVRHSRMKGSGGAFQDQKAMCAMREWQSSKSSNAGGISAPATLAIRA